MLLWNFCGVNRREGGKNKNSSCGWWKLYVGERTQRSFNLQHEKRTLEGGEKNNATKTLHFVFNKKTNPGYAGEQSWLVVPI